MSYDLSPTVDADSARRHPMLNGTSAAARRVADAVDDLLDDKAARYRRLWAYYENPSHVDPLEDGGDSARPYRTAQEWGLPARITGRRAGDEPFEDVPAGVSRKEVVVENDIGWRVDTGVDFLFGRPLVLESIAADEGRAKVISDVLHAVFAAAGGLAFFQQLALLGAVYGGVDVLVKTRPSEAHASGCDTSALGGSGEADASAAEIARAIQLEIVEPPRALPIVDPCDATRVCAYAVAHRVLDIEHKEHRPSDDWIRRLLPGTPRVMPPERSMTVLDVVGPRRWQRYHDGRLVGSGVNPLGTIPLAHVQNTVRPFEYEGGGDVEPLIPLQDELNTRLSDRANRVALQSMKMYLGVGIDGFGDEPVRPGRMWSTTNPDARVTEFAGDGSSPSEAAAIDDVRMALDKLSGVNPAASGAIRGRVGSLTSAVALRLTFQSLLARTERKRANYGAMISRTCELILAQLQALRRFETTPAERGVKLTWSDPVPVDEAGRLEQARLKQQLGIDPDTVRRELGY